MSYADLQVLFDTDIMNMLEGIKGNAVITGFACSPSATPMKITVAAGEAIVNGVYKQTTSSQDLTISDGHASYPRKDLIIINSSGTLTVDEGTPEAIAPEGKTRFETEKPAPNNQPTDGIVLAQIWVPANKSGTVFVAADIADRRATLPFRTGLLPFGSHMINFISFTGNNKYYKKDRWLYISTPDGGYPAIAIFDQMQIYQPESEFIIEAIMKATHDTYSYGDFAVYWLFIESTKGTFTSFHGFESVSGAAGSQQKKYSSTHDNAGIEEEVLLGSGMSWETPVHLKMVLATDDSYCKFYVDGILKSTHTIRVGYTGHAPFQILAMEPNNGDRQIYMLFPPLIMHNIR